MNSVGAYTSNRGVEIPLRGFRTRLLVYFATGKQDVRSAAAHLPALSADSIPDYATTESLVETEDADA